MLKAEVKKVITLCEQQERGILFMMFFAMNQMSVPIKEVVSRLKGFQNQKLDESKIEVFEMLKNINISFFLEEITSQEYKEKFPDKIKIITQENKGLSEARNAALKPEGFPASST